MTTYTPQRLRQAMAAVALTMVLTACGGGASPVPSGTPQNPMDSSAFDFSRWGLLYGEFAETSPDSQGLIHLNQALFQWIEATVISTATLESRVHTWYLTPGSTLDRNQKPNLYQLTDRAFGALLPRSRSTLLSSSALQMTTVDPLDPDPVAVTRGYEEKNLGGQPLRTVLQDQFGQLALIGQVLLEEPKLQQVWNSLQTYPADARCLAVVSIQFSKDFMELELQPDQILPQATLSAWAAQASVGYARPQVVTGRWSGHDWAYVRDASATAWPVSSYDAAVVVNGQLYRAKYRLQEGADKYRWITRLQARQNASTNPQEQAYIQDYINLLSSNSCTMYNRPAQAALQPLIQG